MANWPSGECPRLRARLHCELPRQSQNLGQYNTSIFNRIANSPVLITQAASTEATRGYLLLLLAHVTHTALHTHTSLEGGSRVLDHVSYFRVRQRAYESVWRAGRWVLCFRSFELRK